MINTPIKRGVRVQKGRAKNEDLRNIKEVLECTSQGFGERPEVYGSGGHNGLDLVYDTDTDLYAPFDGFLYSKTESSGYGKYVTIVGKEYKIVLAHLKSFLVPDGWVTQGQLIATGDSTGFSTGPHLHITLKEVDANGNVLNRDNGHDGAIDVPPHLAYLMFQLVQVSGSKEVWLVKDVHVKDAQGKDVVVKKKTHIYNAGALLSISDFPSIKTITQAELDAILDSGLELATLVKE